MTLDQEKSELLQELMTIENILTELWRYHPKNPNYISLEREYNYLNSMKSSIEDQLKKIS